MCWQRDDGHLVQRGLEGVEQPAVEVGGGRCGCAHTGTHHVSLCVRLLRFGACEGMAVGLYSMLAAELLAACGRGLVGSRRAVCLQHTLLQQDQTQTLECTPSG